jgi:thiamine-phosphate pyrophosphorylase
MYAFKNNYFLIIENIKDINLKYIKLTNKFTIIFRNNKKIHNIRDLKRFRLACKSKKIDFYIANDAILMTTLKADGLYISAYNSDLRLNRFKISNYKIIGSAHNIKELNIKKKQGCTKFIYSRLFETKYKHKKGFLGVIRFNLFKNLRKDHLIPLGGINLKNLTKLKLVNSTSFAIMSEIKKKPANIINRLF